jgi:ADP-ribose pyrophosphatase YjhB (NUDIX family)
MIGVYIAIFQDNRLLLTQREDFEVWGLPGGIVEPGETLAQAAMREAKKETGLDIEPALVRIYSGRSGDAPGWETSGYRRRGRDGTHLCPVFGRAGIAG